ncbi:MAG: hypothetical protein WAQ57_04140 [Candidatus Saccharimonadales bacterium]
MSSKRVFYSMIAGIVLLIGLCAAGTYFANKLILAEGKELKELKLQDSVSKKQIITLQQAKKDLVEYAELEKIAKAVVPQEKDQARTVLELVNLARESGITIQSVSFPDSQLGEIKKGGTAAEKKAAEANTGTTQLTPITGLKGVYAMEITVTSDTKQPVTFDRLITYLTRLETNRRTAQVSSINIVPEENDRRVITFTLTLNSFVKP